MNDKQLVAKFEEDLAYDANPPQVLQAIKALKDRVAKYQADEPGEYLVGELDCRWSTSDLRARWKLSQSVWRKTVPSSESPVPSDVSTGERPASAQPHPV